MKNILYIALVPLVLGGIFAAVFYIGYEVGQKNMEHLKVRHAQELDDLNFDHQVEIAEHDKACHERVNDILNNIQSGS